MPISSHVKFTLVFILTAVLYLTSCISIHSPADNQTPSPPSNQISGSTQLSIKQPLNDSRFMAGEVVSLQAATIGNQNIDLTKLNWVSSLSGALGSGIQTDTKKLIAGTHVITVSSGNNKASVTVRVFSDLWQLYQYQPSKEETNRIQSDFTITMKDGDAGNEKWASYNTGKFDQKSADPATIIAFARLDILRRQVFTQPLPFTNNKSAYDHLKSYVRTLNLRLDCDMSTAGGRTVNLNRIFSVWDSRQSGSITNPNACKSPLNSPPVLSEYTNSLYLLLHEARHCEPDDPGHITCLGNTNMDQSLESGSGHARAAIYLMWVYKYGVYDPPAIKEQAKQTAKSILQSRFCSPLKHTNPQVQAIMNELAIQ